MASTTEQIKELRQVTGAGVLDCRNVLNECGGDFGRAVAVLRQKGLAAAEKKADRAAEQGLVGSYIHTGSRVAALVELNCETDFVARTPEFQELAHDLAMQVVAAKALYVRPEEVPADVVEAEMAKNRRVALAEGKPEPLVDRIVQGRMAKFYAQYCLTRQPFIRDEDIVIEDLLKQKIARFGENIVIKRFARLEVGESQ